jgi:hypothetical protein
MTNKQLANNVRLVESSLNRTLDGLDAEWPQMAAPLRKALHAVFEASALLEENDL